MKKISLIKDTLPLPGKEKVQITALPHSASCLALSRYAEKIDWLIIITEDAKQTQAIKEQIRFFNSELEITVFPDWETLPYDHFSPHQDIISARLRALLDLRQKPRGILIVSIQTLMQRLSPREYILQQSFSIKKNARISLQNLQQQLVSVGYHHTQQVFLPGEFAVRGSLLDLFPMGNPYPVRIDFFDDEIDSIRIFDVETQLSQETIENFECLPAHEFPLDENGISQFRSQFRERIQIEPMQCEVYRQISQKHAAQGIEYYLPLFFSQTESLFDYLPHSPQAANLVLYPNCYKQAEQFWETIKQRYESLRYDLTRPLLQPSELYLTVSEVFSKIKELPQIIFEENNEENNGNIDFSVQKNSNLAIENNIGLKELQQSIDEKNTRVLFIAESEGRKEILQNLLSQKGFSTEPVKNWQGFLQSSTKSAITAGSLLEGFSLIEDKLTLITENELLGQKTKIISRSEKSLRDPDLMVRHLAELQTGDLVVHIEHGVGRYLGLKTIETQTNTSEFVTLEYADNTKLYVPITSLDRISRYSNPQQTNHELNKLGSNQWEKTKEKINKKIHDVAAELLEIHAKRHQAKGFAHQFNEADYLRFAEAFPFEETPDQKQAIAAAISDMTSNKMMDRLVCGDVGFGKTEVAMRASFIAISNQKQVAILVPTTLLAEQHLQTFQDRFASWPVRIEALSRFRTATEQKKIKQELAEGKIDIIIGTHALLDNKIKFADLGLLVVDEEHRFGVRQKEKIKALRANVDLLTLTATPIPRTLNMAFASIRDLSVIATPPLKRLSIKTFVHSYETSIIKEAIARELVRGGQVYFLHNDIKSIHHQVNELAKLFPEARIAIGHAQMAEHELERIMREFYHQRYQILVSTTIIESGIHVPSANTIIINHADHFGLAQLHQLRGRVGRSHHQAYAYLLISDEKAITSDAKKRLEAISALEDLGSGFMLASHDLEIRGAGELLGAEQSGHMEEVGFSLYMELLDSAVKALKDGKTTEDLFSRENSIEIDLPISAYIPNNYINDVALRLMFYKRIANAKTQEQLDEIQVELIDRFGLLTAEIKNLFAIQKIKSQATQIGIQKISGSQETIRFDFNSQPKINTAKIIRLIQIKPNQYKLNQKNQLYYQLLDNNKNHLEVLPELMTSIC